MLVRQPVATSHAVPGGVDANAAAMASTAGEDAVALVSDGMGWMMGATAAGRRVVPSSPETP